MKRLVWVGVLLCAAMPLRAQSYYSNFVATNTQMNGSPVSTPANNAYISVCTLLSATSCTPVTVYYDQALTQVMAQPFQTDRYGYFGFWAPSATYQYKLCLPTGCRNYTLPTGGSTGAGGSTAVFPGTSSLVVNTSVSASRSATSSDVSLLLQTAANCTAAGSVYSPASNSCIAASGGAGISTLTSDVSATGTGSVAATVVGVHATISSTMTTSANAGQTPTLAINNTASGAPANPLEALCPNATAGNPCYGLVVGNSFSAHSMGTLAWVPESTGSTPSPTFTQLTNFGAGDPIQIAGSTINTTAPLMVNNGEATYNLLGPTCASGIAFCINPSSNFTVDTTGAMAAKSGAFTSALTLNGQTVCTATNGVCPSGGSSTGTQYTIPAYTATSGSSYALASSSVTVDLTGTKLSAPTIGGAQYASQLLSNPNNNKFATLLYNTPGTSVVADPTLNAADRIGYIANGDDFLSELPSYAAGTLGIDTRTGAFNTFHNNWTPGLSAEGVAFGPTCLIQGATQSGGICEGASSFALESGFSNGNFQDGDAGWNGDSVFSNAYYGGSAGILSYGNDIINDYGVGDKVIHQDAVELKPGMTAASDEGVDIYRLKYNEALPYIGSVASASTANITDTLLSLSPSQNPEKLGVGHPVLDETYDVHTGTVTLVSAPSGAGSFATLTTSFSMPVSTTVTLVSSVSAASIGAPLRASQNASATFAVTGATASALAALVGSKMAFNDGHYDTDAVVAGVVTPTAWLSGTMVPMGGFVSNAGELWQAAIYPQPTAAPAAGPYWTDMGTTTASTLLRANLRHAHAAGIAAYIGGAAGRWLDFAVTDVSVADPGITYTMRYPFLVFASTSATTLIGGFEGAGDINNTITFPWSSGPFTATLYHGSHAAQVQPTTTCSGGSCQLTADGKSLLIAGSESGAFAAGALVEEQGTADQNWNGIPNEMLVYDPLAAVSGPTWQLDGSANKFGNTAWGYQFINNTGNPMSYGFDFMGAVANGLVFGTQPTNSLLNVQNLTAHTTLNVLDLGTAVPLQYNVDANTLQVQSSILAVNDGFNFNAEEVSGAQTAAFTSIFGSGTSTPPVAEFSSTSPYGSPVALFSGSSAFLATSTMPFAPLVELQNTASTAQPWAIGVAGNYPSGINGDYILANNTIENTSNVQSSTIVEDCTTAGLCNFPSGVQSGGRTVATSIPAILYSAAGTSLPACAVPNKGQLLEVSDASSPAYMGTYISGGTITAAVICSYNGSTYSWLTH